MIANKHVRQLIDAGISPAEIAVITPYNAQVRIHISEKIKMTKSNMMVYDDQIDAFDNGITGSTNSTTVKRRVFWSRNWLRYDLNPALAKPKFELFD